MDLKGEQHLALGRERVWDLLNDPEILRQCIPGCEELEADGKDGFSAKVVLKIGPVKATFSGAVKLRDKVHPESYTIVGEGKGGIAGFAKGGAKVKLTPENGGTLLSYDVDAQVGGKIAQLGSRLIASTSKKLAGQFFKKFADVAAEQA